MPGSNAHELEAHEIHRRERRKHEHDANAIRGGILCAALSQEAFDRQDPTSARSAASYQSRFLEETSAVKAYIVLRKRLRTKFRAVAWTTVIVMYLLRRNANGRKGQRHETRAILKTKPAKQPSPRTKAKQFMDKVQKGPICDESPSVLIFKAKQQQDIRTAENRMFRTGELSRLQELRGKNRLDDVEQSILRRLEAKMHGMIMAAELERKENEHRQKKIQRNERLRENEEKYLRAQIVAKIRRSERRRRMRAQYQNAIRVAVKFMTTKLSAAVNSLPSRHSISDAVIQKSREKLKSSRVIPVEEVPVNEAAIIDEHQHVFARNLGVEQKLQADKVQHATNSGMQDFENKSCPGSLDEASGTSAKSIRFPSSESLSLHSLKEIQSKCRMLRKQMARIAVSVRRRTPTDWNGRRIKQYQKAD